MNGPYNQDLEFTAVVLLLAGLVLAVTGVAEWAQRVSRTRGKRK